MADNFTGRPYHVHRYSNRNGERLSCKDICRTPQVTVGDWRGDIYPMVAFWRLIRACECG